MTNGEIKEIVQAYYDITSVLEGENTLNRRQIVKRIAYRLKIDKDVIKKVLKEQVDD